jgi:hypothetical protein
MSAVRRPLISASFVVTLTSVFWSLPVYAVPLHEDGPFDHRHASLLDFNLHRELTNILAREDEHHCVRKCSGEHNENGQSGGRGGGGGFGLTESLGTGFTAALLGSSGGGLGGHGHDTRISSNLLDTLFDPDRLGSSGSSGLSAGSVSAAPLPATLPLFATGLGLFALFSWWRKRKAAAVRA